MKEYKVSIIIVSFGNLSLLENCLLSLEKYTVGIDHEVIIIDNNSDECTVKFLKNLKKHIYKIIIKFKFNLRILQENNLYDYS